jgi:hypothetical protein
MFCPAAFCFRPGLETEFKDLQVIGDGDAPRGWGAKKQSMQRPLGWRCEQLESIFCIPRTDDTRSGVVLARVDVTSHSRPNQLGCL